MDRLRNAPLLIQRATAAEGVMDRDELVDAGLSEPAIDSRLRRGQLLLLHERVYLVPHVTLSARARWRAALKAHPDAVLARVSGGAYWSMCRDRAVGVELLQTKRGRGDDAVELHWTRSLPDTDWVLRDGVRVCTPLRILVDMAPFWSEGQLLAAAHEAEHRGFLDVEGLLRLDLNGRRGATRMRAVQQHYLEGTRNDFEARLRALCIEGGLPEPVGQHDVRGWQVDIAWPELRFGVECQSWRWHKTRAAFEKDARKQLVLARHGWEIVPVTWRGLDDRPAEVLAALRRRIDGGASHRRSP